MDATGAAIIIVRASEVLGVLGYDGGRRGTSSSSNACTPVPLYSRGSRGGPVKLAHTSARVDAHD